MICEDPYRYSIQYGKDAEEDGLQEQCDELATDGIDPHMVNTYWANKISRLTRAFGRGNVVSASDIVAGPGVREMEGGERVSEIGSRGGRADTYKYPGYDNSPANDRVKVSTVASICNSDRT